MSIYEVTQGQKKAAVHNYMKIGNIPQITSSQEQKKLFSVSHALFGVLSHRLIFKILVQ